MVWKSVGDGKVRKYDFNYDAANRLMKADFNQYTGSVFDKSANVDFSVTMGDGATATSAYDANGNILSMTQKGLMLNASSTIDQLTYTYNTNSNKLLKVTDAITAQNNLGDFNDGSSGNGNDYIYDGNGNLTLDNNKNISSITYNYLNLPSVITITGKGTISYTYDAGGNKLQKITQETGATVPLNSTNYTTNIADTTDYISGFVYESKGYSNAALSSLKYSAVLQYTGTEVGRINPKTNGYEYFLTDHLGNVRMVLTEASPTNYYPATTLEGTYDATSNSMVNNERNFYNISSAYIMPETSIPSWAPESVANTKLYYNNNGNPPPNTSYPTGCTPTQTAGSNNLYKLNATTNRTGLEFMIKVMAGDHIDIFGKSYYLNTTNITNANSTALDVTTLMTNFLLAPANVAAGKGFTQSTLSSINGGSTLNNFIRGNNNEPTTQVPKAYINFMFFDEQFHFVSGNASRVGTSGTVKDHWTTDAQLQNIIAPQNGYIFVYVSNESNFDVFFDNLQVVDKPGAIVEETHYYPFGLAMAGISSQAAGGLQNKYQFLGREKQSNEFSDGSGLEEYDLEARFYDPQIGRFHSIDPLCEYMRRWSPYVYSFDNPIRYADPEGLAGGDSTRKDDASQGSDLNNPKKLPAIVIHGKITPTTKTHFGMVTSLDKINTDHTLVVNNTPCPDCKVDHESNSPYLSRGGIPETTSSGNGEDNPYHAIFPDNPENYDYMFLMVGRIGKAEPNPLAPTPEHFLDHGSDVLLEVGKNQNESKSESNNPDSEPDKGSKKGFMIWIWIHTSNFDTSGKNVYQTLPFYNDSSTSIQFINGKGNAGDTGKVTTAKTLMK